MCNDQAAVDRFLQALHHPLKGEIERIRRIILGAHEGISEHIKWNAPSFCYGGDDRITLKLHPLTSVQVVFHRGSKAKESANFKFEDSTGLIKWVARDRGTITFRSMDDVLAHEADLAKLAKQWMDATG